MGLFKTTTNNKPKQNIPKIPWYEWVLPLIPLYSIFEGYSIKKGLKQINKFEGSKEELNKYANRLTSKVGYDLTITILEIFALSVFVANKYGFTDPLKDYQTISQPKTEIKHTNQKINPKTINLQEIISEWDTSGEYCRINSE